VPSPVAAVGLPSAPTAPRHRGLVALRWATWPLGLGLLLLRAPNELVPLWAWAPLTAAYLFVARSLFRRSSSGSPVQLPSRLWLASGMTVFSLGGLTGAPSAERPAAMLGNATVLLGAATGLLLGGVTLLCRLWDGRGRVSAAIGVSVLVAGSALYLVNLVARFAVVLAGWAPQQAEVEDRAWQASSYLLGLPANDRPAVFLLVFFDLLQVGYVLCAFVASAAFAVALGRSGMLPRRAARTVASVAGGAAGAVVGGIVVAGGVITGAPVSGTVHDIGAGLAFGLTIPFVTTLLPFVTAVCVLHRSIGGAAPSPLPVRTASEDEAASVPTGAMVSSR
jgi:hypothetical protein